MLSYFVTVREYVEFEMRSIHFIKPPFAMSSLPIPLVSPTPYSWKVT